METIGQEIIEEEVTKEIKAQPIFQTTNFNLPDANTIVSDILVRLHADNLGSVYVAYRWVLHDVAQNSDLILPPSGQVYWTQDGSTLTVARNVFSANLPLIGMQCNWDRFGMISYYLTLTYKTKRVLTLWDRIQAWWNGLWGGTK